MYRVTVKTNGKEYLLHEPRDTDGEIQLLEPVVTLEMGTNGTFKFKIVAAHPNKDKILSLKSEVSVYDNDELIFCGRPIGDESNFWLVGEVTCEGDLAYLIDSIQRPFTFTGSTPEFIQKVIQVHNSQVDPEKQFKVGNTTVADSSPDVVRKNEKCENTLKTLRAQLVERNGGYLRVRHVENERYLEYISDYGGINSQVIRFGENLSDMTCAVKPTSIITALIPRGAEIETENTESDTKQYVDIISVNGGKDYIYNQDAVNTYGWIWGTQDFDDVTEPEALLAKAQAYLQEGTVLPETLELTAVDLGLIDVDVSKLKLGYWTQVESAPHGISKRFLLSKKEIHLDDPGKDKIVLGKTRPKFTASTNKDQAAISDRIDRVAASTSLEINRKVENATQLITGGTGGYVVIDVQDPVTGEKMHPWRILIMDTPDKDTARHVIQLNQNGIGFSTTGIAGPYTNAWTIDGNFVADFITTGTMLADRIRGGAMELGGTGLGKNGVFVVKDINNKEIVRIDVNGLQVKYASGLQELIGLIADGKKIQLGDFLVQLLYGRQILQSIDECTGMSGEPNEAGQLYFWAGYHSDDEYGIMVNTDLSTFTQDLWMKRWLDEWFDSAERNYPCNVKLNRNIFADWAVGKMIVELYQMHNWLISQMTDIISDIDRRISDLEDAL